MKWAVLFMAGMATMLMMRCYRDEAVDQIGKQTMCAKLSATMLEFQECIKPESIRIKDKTRE